MNAGFAFLPLLAPRVGVPSPDDDNMLYMDRVTMTYMDGEIRNYMKWEPPQ